MTVQLDLPPFVQHDLDDMARRNGVSPEEIMVIAIAEKVSAMRTAEKLVGAELESVRQRFREMLAKVPNRKPMKGDEITPEFRAKARRMRARRKARTN